MFQFKKHSSKILFLKIVFLILKFSNCEGDRYEGADCYHEATTSEGVCVYISYCEVGSSIEPETCRYEDGLQIVCCPLGNKGNSASRFSDNRAIAEEKCKAYAQQFSDSNYEITHRIVGGENASLGEFPHFAVLGYGDYDDLQWQCGGSLISEDFILTAAHCILDDYLPKVAQMGDVMRDTYLSKTYRIKKTLKHPEYSRGLSYNDIGLVQLETKVSFTEYIKPACLPVETTSDFYKKLTVCGFGKLAFEEVVISQTLQKVDLYHFSTSECNFKYRNSRKKLPYGVVEDTQLCYGSPLKPERKDSCNGDSGGPLQHYEMDLRLYRIIGIVSTGLKKCGTPGTPGIYTRISHYVPWIVEKVWGKNS